MPYNREAAVQYAQKWALSTNSEFPRMKDNDCTNFVSQCLLAGGWRMAGPIDSGNRKSAYFWWYDQSAWFFYKSSYTWGGAQNLYYFLEVSTRGLLVDSSTQLDRGDIIQLAFANGHVHHSMIVSGKTPSDLLLCYHTDDQLNTPLSALLVKNKDDKFIYWKIDDSKAEACRPEPMNPMTR